jgi:excisionase family DNA binding protein
VEKSMDLLSITEAAKVLGISRQRVWKLIQGLKLSAQKVGNVYVINTTEVNNRRLLMLNNQRGQR